MRFYSTKFVPCVAVFGLAMLAGCGDTYEVTEATGMKVIAIDEKVPDCTKDNVGEMIFVAKVSEVYYCANNEWSTLNGKDGEDGVDGKDGVNGENGKNGENGENGLNGAQGEQGVQGEKGVQGAQGVQGVQGEKGDTGAGCTSEDKLDGRVILTCGTGDDAVTTTLYKAMCGTQYYDPEKKSCYEGKLYSCDDKPYDPTKKFCSGTALYSCDNKPYDPEKSKCVDERVIVTPGTMTDPRDNDREYKIVTIGTQTWMAENLNYNTNTDDETNSWCGGGSGKTEGDCSVYGRFYARDVAMDACPTGWHLPSKAEWEDLIAAVGGMDVAGKKLKSATSDWNGSGKGDDSYGFSALPAGFRYYVGGFYYDTGTYAYFWSSTVYENNTNYYVGLGYDYENASLNSVYKYNGYSVRCVKD